MMEIGIGVKEPRIVGKPSRPEFYTEFYCPFVSYVTFRKTSSESRDAMYNPEKCDVVSDAGSVGRNEGLRIHDPESTDMVLGKAVPTYKLEHKEYNGITQQHLDIQQVIDVSNVDLIDGTKLDPNDESNMDHIDESHVDPIDESHVDPIDESHVDPIDESHVDLVGEPHVDPIVESPVDSMVESPVDPIVESHLDPNDESNMDAIDETHEDNTDKSPDGNGICGNHLLDHDYAMAIDPLNPKQTDDTVGVPSDVSDKEEGEPKENFKGLANSISEPDDELVVKPTYVEICTGSSEPFLIDSETEMSQHQEVDSATQTSQGLLMEYITNTLGMEKPNPEIEPEMPVPIVFPRAKTIAAGPEIPAKKPRFEDVGSENVTIYSTRDTYEYIEADKENDQTSLRLRGKVAPDHDEDETLHPAVSHYVLFDIDSALRTPKPPAELLKPPYPDGRKPIRLGLSKKSKGRMPLHPRRLFNDKPQ